MATSNGRVTLIQCTDSKRDESAPARDLYDESRYFRKMRAWAEARGNPWYILSAKHGLAAPSTVLDDYDERGLSGTQAENIAVALVAMGFDTADVTAGRDYTGPLIPELEARGIEVVNHFSGLKIGERERELVRATEQLRDDP